MAIEAQRRATIDPVARLEALEGVTVNQGSDDGDCNVICHGSWRLPDAEGRSVPLFYNQKGEKFETLIDVEYLELLQRHTVELIIATVNTVTHMGRQFPGSDGPGVPIYRIGNLK